MTILHFAMAGAARDDEQTTDSARCRPTRSSGRAPEPWLLRAEEAAELLNLSRSTVYVLMASGRLPSITINRCRRIPADALRRWLDDQVGESW